MRHLRKLFTEKFCAIGIDRGRAVELAKETVQALIASEVVSLEKVNAWEQDAQIYELRSHKVPAAEVARCYLVGKSTVFESVRRYTKRRRAVLKGE